MIGLKNIMLLFAMLSPIITNSLVEQNKIIPSRYTVKTNSKTQHKTITHPFTYLISDKHHLTTPPKMILKPIFNSSIHRTLIFNPNNHCYFTGKFASQAMKNWRKLIQKYANQYHVSSKMIASIVYNESGGNPYAISTENAIGLMQIDLKAHPEYTKKQLYDPETNIKVGIREYSMLLTYFHSNPALALASYNAGITNVEKYGGIPPYPETVHYVQAVVSDIPRFSHY